MENDTIQVRNRHLRARHLSVSSTNLLKEDLVACGKSHWPAAIAELYVYDNVSFIGLREQSENAIYVFTNLANQAHSEIKTKNAYGAFLLRTCPQKAIIYAINFKLPYASYTYIPIYINCVTLLHYTTPSWTLFH